MDKKSSEVDYLTKGDIILLNEKEGHLIGLLREIAYGRVTIFMENGMPVRIEKIIESVKL